MARLEMTAIQERFIQAFLADDVDGVMQLFDQDCEWVLMATGETFRGSSEIRPFAERSVAGRKHTKDDHMVFTNAFAGEDQPCFEYTHRGIVTQEWLPSSSIEHPV